MEYGGPPLLKAAKGPPHRPILGPKTSSSVPDLHKSWLSLSVCLSVCLSPSLPPSIPPSLSLSHETCKAPIKLSPTNQHPAFYRPDAPPVTQPTASQHWRNEKLKSLRRQNHPPYANDWQTTHTARSDNSQHLRNHFSGKVKSTMLHKRA